MTSSQDLYSKFKELMDKPISSESPDNPEMVSTLFQNDWIRILIVRNKQNPELITIEIESSLPLHAQGIPDDPEDGKDVRTLLEGMIRALEYLLHLEDAGFSLDIIGQDCMWTAFLECNKPPTKEFFQRILPY